jgi:hypothetical protein
LDHGRRLPEKLLLAIARVLLANGWFSPHLILDRWFLHRDQPALGRSSDAFLFDAA